MTGREGFDALNTPIERLTGPDSPAAASWALEQAGVPQLEVAARAVRVMRSLAALP
jgi:pyruvate dehydrogenase E1 component beta subunit